MQVRVTPSGNLDKDTELVYVGQGNYVDANDIRHRHTGDQNFGGIMSVLGNKNVITATDDTGATVDYIPGYTAKTKIYRVYFDLSAILNGSVTANVGNITLVTSAGNAFTSSNFTLNIAVAAGYAAALQAELNFLAASAGYGGPFVFGPLSAGVTPNSYFFTLSTTFDTDFVFQVQNITAKICEFKLAQEYVNTPGSFKVVGSQQLDDEATLIWLAGSNVTAVGSIISEVSEIGVLLKLQGANLGKYQYRRLIRSKQLGFSQQRRIEAEIEKIGNQINLYWTDGNNKPRAMYLKTSNIYVYDGFLFFNGGKYELETIDEETSFFYRNPSAYIDELRVVEGEGAVVAGNKRYTGRFLTEDLVATDFLYPTGIVNLYEALSTNPHKIAGDEVSTVTKKSVKMKLKNFTAGVYKFFELVAIEYEGDVFSAKMVQRFKIENQQTELELVHNNQGQENILLSNNELVAITAKYLTIKTIKIFDNRMTMSNLTEQVDYNLSDWASQITHSITQKYITGIGKPGNPTTADPTYQYGEYQDPNNVLNNTGYMINDTYRFGIQVQWKGTGKWSAPFWVDDIRFDDLDYNITLASSRRDIRNRVIGGVDVPNNRLLINNHGYEDGDEVRFTITAGLPGILMNTTYFVINSSTNSFQITSDYYGTQIINPLIAVGTGSVRLAKIDPNLTNNAATLTKVYYPKFHNLNLDYLVGGVPIRDLINGYRFVRAERIPEVLATGYFFTSLFSGAQWHPYGILNLWESPRAPIPGGFQNQRRLFFYSPDLYFGESYSFSSTDKLKILLPFNISDETRFRGVANGTVVNSYSDTSGYFGDQINFPYNYTDYTLISSIHIDTGNKGVMDGETFALGNIPTYADWLTYTSCEVFKLTSPVAALGVPYNTNEIGNYYGQIFRDLGANKKYPVNKEQTVYHSTGHIKYLTIGQNGIVDNIKIFGGDIFTQKSHMLLRNNTWADIGGKLNGAGVGFSFYSQNRLNSQMFDVLPHDNTFSGPGNVYPQQLDKSKGGTYAAGTWGSGVLYWTEQWPDVSNQNNYNDGYTPKDGTIIELGYNINSTYDGSMPNRIVWSAKKVIGSQKDNYRFFQPLDYADLDLTLGPITHHDIIDNNFYTWQPFSFQRQYFRDATYSNASSGSDIVVGSGSILGARGQQISSVGLFGKWQLVKGKTNTGKDTVYWFNEQVKKMMRFGQDGVRVISDKGLITFLNNNTTWVSEKYHPITGQGVHGIWNDKYSEAIFTFKGYNNNIPYWEEPVSYNVGDYIYITPIGTYTHSSGLPYFYKCKLAHTAAAGNKPETGASWTTYWTKITPGEDSYATTCFTIAYDEMKNGFVSFHSYWPNIYLKYNNIYYSPKPTDEKYLWLHDLGPESDYYGVYTAPDITAVMNYDPDLIKHYEAILVNSDKNPFNTVFTTKNHYTVLDETEFELREDLWYSPIKNDMTVALANNTDTSRLWGYWLKVKMSLESAGNQKIKNFIIKFRPSPRLYNQ